MRVITVNLACAQNSLFTCNKSQSLLFSSVINIENIGGKLDQGHKAVGQDDKADHCGDQELVIKS